MKKPSDKNDPNLKGLLGLGEQSSRKSYYAELEIKLEELELERNRYKGLFDHSLHGIFQCDPQGHLLNANLAMAHICGYSDRRDFLDKVSSLQELFSERSTYSDFEEQLFQKGLTKGFEACLKLDRDDSKPIYVSITAIMKTEPSYVIEGFVQDITEQKNAARELLVAATAFESQEGMMITDVNRKILRVNKAFTQVTGYLPEEVIGKTPAVLQSGRHDQRFYKQMDNSLKRQKYWQGEIWNKRKSGEVYPEYLTITAVESSEGEVTNYVGAFTDITRIKESEESIQRLAYFDSLTSLANRQYLMGSLAKALKRARRTGLYGAILYIDLDNFKNVNDTQGHSVGDELLIAISERLKSCIRETDIAARLGGDEFVVLLEHLGEDERDVQIGVNNVLDKINAKINDGICLNNFEYHASCSIGITPFNGTETSDEVMKRADMAMYQAKWSGKNTCRYYDPDDLISQFQLAELEVDLRNALSNKQLRLFYQPQFDLRQLTGAEALIRWEHPEKGLIPPVEFIPLAEETGLIVPIGWWIIETACIQLKQWADKPGMDHLQIAVNVSARQFSQINFVEGVTDILNKTGADPNLLKLELTESLLVTDVEDTINKMNQLRQKGIRFSLDDFGTGYSSLSHLKRLPLEQLKIDASFVRDIATDPDDAEIVQTIIAMAFNLGLDVIAEGVETIQQREYLELSKCHNFQGYLFGKPQPISEFTENYLSPSACA
jgi:diguanylate cyclase (GGDEF)-like protein/PAS domain S-box-containing protein